MPRDSRPGFEVVHANDVVVAPLRKWHYVAVEQHDGYLLFVEQLKNVRIDLVSYWPRERLVDDAREVALYELGGKLAHLCYALLAHLAPHLSKSQLIACLAREPVDLAHDWLEEVGYGNAGNNQADLSGRRMLSDERAGTWRRTQKTKPFQLRNRPHGSRPGHLESSHDPRQAWKRMCEPILPGAYVRTEFVCNGKIPAVCACVPHVDV